ncbi:hypothetical protein ACFQ9X_02300 [Catenulispora yoronensis]
MPTACRDHIAYASAPSDSASSADAGSVGAPIRELTRSASPRATARTGCCPSWEASAAASSASSRAVGQVPSRNPASARTMSSAGRCSVAP